MARISRKQNDCPYMAATTTLKKIGGRWKVLIIWELLDGAKRYSELRRAMPEITEKMLGQQLAELEEDGLLVRQELVHKPPKVVQYELSEMGLSARAMIHEMVAWGRQFNEV